MRVPRRLHHSALVALLSALLTASCTGSDSGLGPDAQRGDAEVSVEVYAGLSGEAPSIEPAPVHMLVDVSALVDPETVAALPAARLLQLSRDLAESLVEERSELRAAEYHPFHRYAEPAPGTRCPNPSDGSELFATQALNRIAQELSESEQESDARVVLVTSFENECGLALCEAAARLVRPGAWLETVRIGESDPAPRCLDSLRPAARDALPWLSEWRGASNPRFEVEALADPDSDPNVINRGQAWGAPVRVSPGLRQIRVELDPPEVIGPFVVRSGDKLRIRLLSFPLSAPQERSWTVERAR